MIKQTQPTEPVIHTVLLIEDDPIDQKQMERLLKAGSPNIRRISCEASLKQCLYAIEHDPVDLIILDLNLPDSTGLDTLVKVQQHAGRIPIIVVTGHEADGLGIQAMGAGAQDYLEKGEFGASVLARTMRYAVQRKRTEDALLDSEMQYRRLFETMTQGVVYQDADGRITSANPAAEEILGLPLDQMQGQTSVAPRWKAIYEDGSDYPGHDHPSMVALRTGKPVHNTLIGIFNPKLEGYVWLNISATPLYMPGEDRPSEVYTTFENITHRRAIEQEIRKANQDLEQANRDLKQIHAQVLQNEKLASIGQLAAGVAHEMNTPVGFVASNFQTLQKYMTKFLDLFRMYETLGSAVEDGLKDKRLSILDQIKTARMNLKIDFVLNDIQGLFDESREGLARVTSIVQNLRDFSRVDQEGLSEYNINDGIKATLIVARNEIKYDSDVVLELGEVPPIVCNAGQLNQVFLNILVNASQAIRSQEGRTDRGIITIRTYTDAAATVCEISDNGPGIAQENLKRIFDPFFTTKPAGKGTGLGLSIAHDIIVSKHKGQLSVKSTLGQGTTFNLRLPLRAAPVDCKA